MVPRSSRRWNASTSIISYSASYRGFRYGSIFSYRVPGRSPNSSSNRWATRSASSSSPVIVISFPRTRMCDAKADSISRRSSSRCPRRATMGWLPGTRIFTCVLALAKDVCLNFGDSWGWTAAPTSVGKGAALPATPPHQPKRLYGRSPGRPSHAPASQEVEVQVRHALPRVGPGVRHQSPPRTGHPFRVSQVRGALDQLRQQASVMVGEPCRRFDVLSRDQQDVGGGLGVDVSKRHDVVGLVHDVRRYLLRRDLAEQAVRRPLGHGA